MGAPAHGTHLRVTAISLFISSLYSSICLSVLVRRSRSAWYLSTCRDSVFPLAKGRLAGPDCFLRGQSQFKLVALNAQAALASGDNQCNFHHAKSSSRLVGQPCASPVLLAAAPRPELCAAAAPAPQPQCGPAGATSAHYKCVVLNCSRAYAACHRQDLWSPAC